MASIKWATGVITLLIGVITLLIDRNPLKRHKLVVFEAHLGNFLSQGARGSASPPTSTAADVADTKKDSAAATAFPAEKRSHGNLKGLVRALLRHHDG